MLTTLHLLRSLKAQRTALLAVLSALCVLVAACGTDSEQSAQTPVGPSSSADGEGPEFGDSLDEYLGATESESSADSELADSGAPDGFQELDWEELVPPGFSSDEIYARYEDRLAAVADGSPEATEIYEEMQAEFDDDAVNTQYNGKNVQLAGFVAPLTYEDDIITEFLLVPYFGACIHVPPPPPNQTIMVTLDKSDGLTIDDSWGAVWVAGSLTANSSKTDLATAGYSITGATSGVYEDY